MNNTKTNWNGHTIRETEESTAIEYLGWTIRLNNHTGEAQIENKHGEVVGTQFEQFITGLPSQGEIQNAIEMIRKYWASTLQV